MMKKLISLVLNRYIIAIALFAVWLMFFDNDNLIDQYARLQELKHLQTKKEYYSKQIEKTNSELLNFETNPALIEKIARERHYMKKAGEDIFLYKSDSTN